jgi:hypothetical protein
MNRSPELPFPASPGGWNPQDGSSTFGAFLAQVLSRKGKKPKVVFTLQKPLPPLPHRSTF